MDKYFYLLLYFVTLALLFPTKISTGQAARTHFSKRREGINGVEPCIIGAILECSSRVGKEERVAMEMAVEDLYKKQSKRLILRIKCSHGEPVQAAHAARHLINKNRVQAILGPDSWEESSAVAEVGEQFHVPILSFSDSTPPWATGRWPFFIEASPSTSKQMEAVAAIVQSWGWRGVSVIYEDTYSAANGLITHLYGALQQVGAQMSSLVPLPSFASPDMLNVELEKLKGGQCRVFVVHASLGLAARVFENAKELKMMARDYVWITTDSTTSLVHSMNASIVSSMQGVVGVRRYFPDRTQVFRDFYVKFHQKFRQKYPEETSHEPGIFAVQAYDATWTLASAINVGSIGWQILEKFEETDFNGLSGKIQFKGKRLAPINQFQIINVVGKSYRELGFWCDGLGFSTVGENTSVYNFSMESLGHVFWPGGPWSTPRGWDLPTISNPLRIGVPNGSLTNKFVKIEYDPSTNNYNASGFSIDVFRKTLLHLQYSLPYQFIPFDGSYTDLVKQVRLKVRNFSIVIFCIVRPGLYFTDEN
ncbi:hypothetical protein Pfo_022735 [Paulownia fortunei]|nr:hypothetical protein Pfo_022735 [Paulownia fortunei]